MIASLKFLDFIFVDPVIIIELLQYETKITYSCTKIKL